MQCDQAFLLVPSMASRPVMLLLLEGRGRSDWSDRWLQPFILVSCKWPPLDGGDISNLLIAHEVLNMRGCLLY